MWVIDCPVVSSPGIRCRDVLPDRGGRDVGDPAVLALSPVRWLVGPVSSTQSFSSGSHDSRMHRFAVSSEWPGCGSFPGANSLMCPLRPTIAKSFPLRVARHAPLQRGIGPGDRRCLKRYVISSADRSSPRSSDDRRGAPLLAFLSLFIGDSFLSPGPEPLKLMCGTGVRKGHPLSHYLSWVNRPL